MSFGIQIVNILTPEDTRTHTHTHAIAVAVCPHYDCVLACANATVRTHVETAPF